eukprot:TRINITY_DN6652_c0_g1_i1.p1 TRINITY_DN6652_c0_g1~~TRINITY_DN6652_c0_g1_i1.p1  ORF type:complete len:245 (+),score=41.35 TRINITY_DN6652_c0_g1_i1:73-807(+)
MAVADKEAAAFNRLIRAVLDQGELLKITKLLSKYPALVAKKEEDPSYIHFGFGALHHAADKGYLEAVKVLVNFGADVNSKAKRDWTPLKLAAARGHETTVEFLLQQNADINVVTSTGWTPLHAAAWYDRSNIVRLLISHGAKKFLKDKSKRTPYYLSVQRRAYASQRVFEQCETLVELICRRVVSQSDMTGLDEVLPSELLQMCRDYQEVHQFQQSDLFQRFDRPLARLRELAMTNQASAASSQ